MTVLIKKSDSKLEMKKKIIRVTSSSKRKQTKSGFDAMKFLGKLKGVYGDPLEHQKRMRDEWN
jgi:hypothetical protein